MKEPTSVRNLMGLIKTFSMFQAYKRKDPQMAEDLLLNTQKRSQAHTHTHTHRHA